MKPQDGHICRNLGRYDMPAHNKISNIKIMNSKNSKILFVVSEYQQYRAYIQTQALKEIKDRVVFIVHPKLADADFGVPSDRVIPYTYSDRKDVLHRRVFFMNAWQNKKRLPVF